MKYAGLILAMVIALLSGCQMVALRDKTAEKNGRQHTVSAFEASLLSNQQLQDLDIDYNGVKIKIADWRTKGDAEFVKAVGNAIVNGIMAYGSAGGSEAVRAAVMASMASMASMPKTPPAEAK